MLISEIYRPHPETISDTMSAAQVIQKMIASNVNSFIVLNSDKRVVGVVSLQDIASETIPREFREHIGVARAMYKQGFFHEVCHAIKDRPISDFMRKKFITVDLQTNIMAVIADFLENDLYIVPVVDEKQVIGIITRTEVRRALAKGMGVEN